MSVTLANTPVLETKRLVLRAPQASDVEPALAFMVTDRAQYIGGPYTRHTAWRGIGHVIGHWVMRGYGLFIFCDKTTGAPLGITGPYFPEGWTEPELGWSVWAPEAEGKGIAFEAAQTARAYAYDTLGWTTAVSFIDPENARSIALAKRMGATQDTGCAYPDLPGWEGTIVMRHPGPEALA